MKIRDLSAWESFYWVAKEASFTRAARRQNVGLPLISKRIACLEQELGVRLFQRSTRRVGLTQEGKSLLPQVQSLLEDIRDMEERTCEKKDVRGTIRISCLPAFAHRVLPTIIAKYSQLHPQVKFELELADALIDLIDHQIDLAIRVQEPSGADFVFKKLIPNRLVTCASPRYLNSVRKPVRTPKDLLSHRILTLRVYEDCRFERSTLTVGDLLGARSVICESGFLLTELARQGQGIAIRSIWDVAPLLKAGELIQVLNTHPLESFGEVYAVIPSRRLLATRVKSFIHFLEAEMAKQKSAYFGSS